jgi:streptogramin lyase
MFRSRLHVNSAGLALAVTAALAVGAPATAGAAPAVHGEFPVTEMPHHLVEGPDGNVWVAEGGHVAKVTPAGVVTEYAPTAITSANGIASGPDGNLWITESDAVAKFSPADPMGATKYPIASITDARQIVTGPDGNLWTASADQLVKIPPADPATATATTITGMSARDIVRGGDGNLWIADFTGRIIKVTTGGAFTPITVGGGPQAIAAGPGKQIAFANPGNVPQQVGRISPGSGPKTNNIPNTDPFGITRGPDGAYWFGEFAKSRLARLTTDGHLTIVGGLSAGSGPRYVTPGPNHTLWVSLEQGMKIARVTGVVADPAPRITRLSLAHHMITRGTRSLSARFTLSERASVRIVVRRNGAAVETLTRSRHAGRDAISIRTRSLARAHYRVTITATDSAHQTSHAAVTPFRVV